MTEEWVFDYMLMTMQNARHNKRYGRDCSDFERMWAPRLVRMMHRLLERTFRIDHNYAFLTSVPKWREVFATIFEGRIADHLLCNTLEPYIEKELHPRTFNNRKGMGGLAAINRVIDDIYEVSYGYSKPCRIIKWDLKGFFPNAVNDEIERCFCRVIEKYHTDIMSQFDEEMPNFLRWLTMICVHNNPTNHCELHTPKHFWTKYITPDKSLFNKEPGIGAPIGRWVSQVGMGLYLNDDVCWLNDDCGIHATLFMDDCVMVVPEELHEYTLGLIPELRRRLSIKGIRMNEKKFYDQPYQHGLEFLGSHIKPNRIHLNNCTYKRAIARINELNNLPNKWKNIDNFLSSVNSYTGLLKGRTDYHRLQQLLKLIDEEWWVYCDWNSDRCCVTCKPKYSICKRLNSKYKLKLKKYGKTRKSRKKKSTSNGKNGSRKKTQ